MAALRDFDAAMIAKLGATTAGNPPQNVTTVLGMTTPVLVLFGMVEEWFTTFTLPAINVSRMTTIPDLSRRLPGFQATAINASDSTLFDQASFSPEPTTLMYQIELATGNQEQLNLLVAHIYRCLPPTGFKSLLTIEGHMVPFRQSGSQMLTSQNDNTKSRVLRVLLTYMVDAWLAIPDSTTVGQILTVDATVEPYLPLG